MSVIALWLSYPPLVPFGAFFGNQLSGQVDSFHGIFAPAVSSDQPPTQIFNFDGKLTFGDFKLSWAIPWAKI